MTIALPFDATVDDYTRQVDDFFSATQAGDQAALWRLYWEVPRFRETAAWDIPRSAVTRADAETVVAHEHAFDTWPDLIAFARGVRNDRTIFDFETAADAVVSGDIGKLRPMLQRDGELVRRRSTRRHHATLLHYIAANGVEGARQKTPPNAIDVGRLLLRSGAAADALADMYESKATTMSMLVSSSHPAEAGLQASLAELLIEHGASLEGTGKHGQSDIVVALAFGFLDTARVLAGRGAPLDLPALAGLGRDADVARLLPSADPRARQIALALAAQHGHAAVVKLLLDAGEDADRYNPIGYHAHSTPMHQAALAGHSDVVRLLVERGARLDMRDTIYMGTPFDWAVHGEHPEIAQYLREKMQPRPT